MWRHDKHCCQACEAIWCTQASDCRIKREHSVLYTVDFGGMSLRPFAVHRYQGTDDFAGTVTTTPDFLIVSRPKRKFMRVDADKYMCSSTRDIIVRVMDSWVLYSSMGDFVWKHAVFQAPSMLWEDHQGHHVRVHIGKAPDYTDAWLSLTQV